MKQHCLNNEKLVGDEGYKTACTAPEVQTTGTGRPHTLYDTHS
jgi:hypothetical protein